MTDSVTFSDVNFKLAVVQVLMYEQNLLTPPFDVYAFVGNYDARQIDIDEEGDQIIPEVKAHFERLEISATALLHVEELYQEGGAEIYLQLCPFWDGEDDRFDIQSATDAALLPNLKTVTLFYSGNEQLLQDFRARGIEATWL